MGKKLYKVYAFAIIVAIVIFLLEISPIGIKTDETPYMLKQFQYFDSNKISSTYIASSSNKKQIAEIEINDAPCEAECVIDYQFSDLCNSHRVTSIDWTVEYDAVKYNDDFSFSSILVTWSDGTQSKIDIGHITITNQVKRGNSNNRYMFEKLEDGEEYEDEHKNIVMKSDGIVRLRNVPHKDVINGFVENLEICGKPLDYFAEDTYLELSMGDEIEVKGKFCGSEEYGRICAIIPIEVEYEDGSKQWSTIYISQKISYDEAVLIGVRGKRSQEQNNEQD